MICKTLNGTKLKADVFLIFLFIASDHPFGIFQLSWFARTHINITTLIA
jgi:hypothetical protein